MQYDACSRLVAVILAAFASSAAAAADPTDAIFDPSRVVDVRITMDSDGWDRLRAQERTLVSVLGGACLAQPFPHPFTWFPADVAIDGQARSNIAVRKKGFLGSLDTVKPALKLDLDEFQDNAGVHGVKKLTLNNAKQDPALVRQCLGYRLFSDAGLPAPRCNFAHVTVNGTALGVYVNVEEIRKPMLARHFASNQGNLYEGTVSDFHAVLLNTFEKQTNESTNDGSDLVGVVDALAANDANLVASLGRVIDLDRFRTYWAMEGLLGFWDGYSANRNNFYLYHDPTSGKFHFLPWGTDGILQDGSPIAAIDPNANPAMFAYSAITRRLVDQTGAGADYAARMNVLLATVWNEATIHAEIDRMQALLAPYAGDLTAELDALRAFVNGRRATVTQALPAPATFPPLSILDYCLAEIGTMSGAFAATWGTNGAAPFTTGRSTLRGAVTGVAPFAAVNGAADAGLSTADPNRYRGFLTLYSDFGDGRGARLDAIVDSTQLVPGARLAIDGQQVKASVLFTEGLVLLDNGSIKLTHASTATNGRLCGTFDAKAYTFTGRYLVGGPTPTAPAAATAPFATSLGPRAGIGDVMRECRPGSED